MTRSALAWPDPELRDASRRAVQPGAKVAEVCLTVRQSSIGWTLSTNDGLAPLAFLTRAAAQHSAFRLACGYVRTGRCVCVLLVAAHGGLLGASRLSAEPSCTTRPPADGC